jgi:hypothetical protein
LSSLLTGKTSTALLIMFFLGAPVQLGSGLKMTVFKSESTGAAVKGWARAAKKKHNQPDHVHEPLSPHERIHGIGIIGINKALSKNGHPVDIPLGTKVHNGHVEAHQHKIGHPQGHPQGHPHPGAHSKAQGTPLLPACPFPSLKISSYNIPKKVIVGSFKKDYYVCLC